MADFVGFPNDTIAFLLQLKRNNKKAWFEKNKDRYEQLVREPALEFIRAMEAPIKRISKHLRVVASKQGGSLMRVHRDVRFSNDKTPYKTNIGIHFRHDQGKMCMRRGCMCTLNQGRCFWAPVSGIQIQLPSKASGNTWMPIEVRGSERVTAKHFANSLNWPAIR